MKQLQKQIKCDFQTIYTIQTAEQLSLQLIEYFIYHQFCEWDDIVDDICNEYDDCCCKEILFKVLRLTNIDQKNTEYLRLKRCINAVNLIQDNHENDLISNISDLSDEYDHNESIQIRMAYNDTISMNPPPPPPPVINWNINDNDLDVIRKEIKKQIFDINDLDESLFVMMYIERINNMQIMTILDDIYKVYLLKNKEIISWDKFCSISGLIEKIKCPQSMQQILKRSLSSYRKRIAPLFMPSNKLIIDDCNDYIEFILVLSRCIKYIGSLENSLPFHLDLVIVPKQIKYKNIQINDDEFDDDDLKEFEEFNNTPNVVHVDNDRDIINSLININYTTDSINLKFPEITKIRNNLRKHLNVNKKIIMILNRKKEKNNLITYNLEDGKYGKIDTNYFKETFIHSTASHIIPNPSGNNQYFGGKDYKQFGDILIVSFICRQIEKIQCQTFYGGGTFRFWPKHLIEFWPKLFDNSDVEKRYNIQHIKQNFMLNISDPTYQSFESILLTEQ